MRIEDSYGLTIDDPSYFTFDMMYQEVEFNSISNSFFYKNQGRNMIWSLVV